MHRYEIIIYWSNDDETFIDPRFARLNPNHQRAGAYPLGAEGTNLILLDHDVAEAFPTDKAVNEALRLVIQGSQHDTKTIL